MPIPTEPVGSLPRPMKLQEAIKEYDAGKITKEQLAALQDAATASYGPDWRLRASLAALAGALVGGAAAATVVCGHEVVAASAAGGPRCGASCPWSARWCPVP